MFAKSLMATAAALMIGSAAYADTIEVKMLNRGEEGAMVFEPAFVQAQPGDTILFVATDRGHNAESIDGMLPEGVESFRSPMGKDFELVVEAEGLYGIKCTPHYAMGMIALIQVGEPVNLEQVQQVSHRGKATERFEDAFSNLSL